MKRFRKILVSVNATNTDEQPHALVRAIRLAKDTGAELLVVDVLNTLPHYVQSIFLRDEADDVLADELASNLDRLCHGKDTEGLKITTRVLRGRPIRELIRTVEEESCDLLIRNVSGANEPGNLFFGSLDMRLIRNCPCPVWLVKPRPAMFERVLAAIDPLPESREEEKQNERIIDLAASLADWEDGQVFAVAAWQVRGEPLLVTKMAPERFKEHVDEIAVTARTHFRNAMRSTELAPVKANQRFEAGEPSEVIRKYAQEIDADVIVMGTLARTGIPGLLIGNTAERVLRQVRSSVLTIKPKDFVSPVIADLLDAGDLYAG